METDMTRQLLNVFARPSEMNPQYLRRSVRTHLRRQNIRNDFDIISCVLSSSTALNDCYNVIVEIHDAASGIDR